MSYIGIVQVEDGKLRSGSGMLVNADGSVDVNVRETVMVDSGSVAMGSLSATTSSQQLRGAEARSGMMVKNFSSSSTVYIGVGGSDVSTATGFPLAPGEQFLFPAGLASGLAVHVIGATGGEDVRFMVFQ